MSFLHSLCQLSVNNRSINANLLIIWFFKQRQSSAPLFDNPGVIYSKVSPRINFILYKLNLFIFHGCDVRKFNAILIVQWEIVLIEVAVIILKIHSL